MNLTSRRPTYDLARRIAVHRADAAGRRFDVCQPTPRRNSTMQLHSGLRLTRREHYADIKSTSNATHGLAWRGAARREATRRGPIFICSPRFHSGQRSELHPSRNYASNEVRHGVVFFFFLFLFLAWYLSNIACSLFFSFAPISTAKGDVTTRGSCRPTL